MSNVAISVEGLGKRYRIGAGPSEPYGNIRESLVRAAGAPLRRLRGGASGGGAMRDAWALKDVSFEVKHGEAVGIIGRNGAGKSTLLKVLSRITEPTTGQAVVHGRVGSLLEVGTGFHPELTGRENIYLNGAVMGMSRADIKRRFDEIVDFSGVETYLDTPVKRYSSGMYMRLAFAVAAHLEPEVLVVDEVLAVGDAEFQKKCLGKMSKVVSEGRTVLFVSHNMAAVSNLCLKSVLLKTGVVDDIGETRRVIASYVAPRDQDNGYIDLSQKVNQLGNGSVVAESFWFEDEVGQLATTLMSGDAVRACVRYRAINGRSIGRLSASIALLDLHGSYLLLHRTSYTNHDIYNASPQGVLRWHIPKLPLVGGQYLVEVYLEANNEPAYLIDDSYALTVEDGDYYGTGAKGSPAFSKFLPDGYWSWRSVDDNT